MARAHTTAQRRSVHRRTHRVGLHGRRRQDVGPALVPAGHRDAPACRGAGGGSGVHNQMLKSEQAARTAAEAARRASDLQVDVGGLLAASLDCSSTLSRIPPLIVPATADVFFVDLLVEGSLVQTTMACADAVGAERLQTREPPDRASEHPIAQAIRTGVAVHVTDVTAS